MEEEVSGTVSEMVSENPEVEDVGEIVVVSEEDAVVIGAVVGTGEALVAEVVDLEIGVHLRGTLVATGPHPETLVIDPLQETLMTDLQETVTMTGKVMMRSLPFSLLEMTLLYANSSNHNISGLWLRVRPKI